MDNIYVCICSLLAGSAVLLVVVILNTHSGAIRKSLAPEAVSDSANPDSSDVGDMPLDPAPTLHP